MPTLEELLSFGAKLVKSGELLVRQRSIEQNGFMKRNNNQILIVINDEISSDKKIKTLIHELIHLYMGHNYITPAQDELEAETLTESLWKGGNSFERAHWILQSEEW